MFIELKLKHIENCFNAAIAENYEYIGVAVSVNGAVPEIIINSKENFEAKLAYYKTAYNDDLTLKANPLIKITGFCQENNFEAIENFLIKKILY